jgi:NADH-quinone oxidoreductase subunit H
VSTNLIIGLSKAFLILGFLLTNTILLIWLERKLVAGMQSRVGPDRAGPFGILQTVADAIKLLLKEQILPLKADRAMYLLAPILALVPSFLIFMIIPLGPSINLVIGGESVNVDLVGAILMLEFYFF